MSMGNWSVSHPRSGEPVFESTEPSMPNLSTNDTECNTVTVLKLALWMRHGNSVDLEIKFNVW